MYLVTFYQCFSLPLLLFLLRSTFCPSVSERKTDGVTYSHSWLSSEEEEGEGRGRPGSGSRELEQDDEERSGCNDWSKGWWREKKSDSSAESVCRVKDGGGDEGIIPSPTSHSEGGQMSAVPGNSSTALTSRYSVELGSNKRRKSQRGSFFRADRSSELKAVKQEVQLFFLINICVSRCCFLQILISELCFKWFEKIFHWTHQECFVNMNTVL